MLCQLLWFKDVEIWRISPTIELVSSLAFLNNHTNIATEIISEVLEHILEICRLHVTQILIYMTSQVFSLIPNLDIFLDYSAIVHFFHLRITTIREVSLFL